jgi:hypothetical protein
MKAVSSLHIVYYWSGKLPRVAELSIASALARFPDATVDLWLDNDPGFKSEFPKELNWLRHSERFRLKPFSMKKLLESYGFLRVKNHAVSLERGQHWLAQRFSESTLSKNPLVIKLGDSAPLRPFLGHFTAGWGWFRAGPPAHTIDWAGVIYRDDLFKILIERNYPNANVLCADLDVYFAAFQDSWPLQSSFTSRWGDESFANNPVLFFNENRPGMSEIFHKYLEKGVPARPWHFFNNENCATFGIKIFDCAQFDPGWNPSSISHGRADLFMKDSPDSKRFIEEIEGISLSVHWHNQWQSAPPPSSPYSHFLRECKQLLNG